MFLIEVEDLYQRYGSKEVLKGLTLSIEKGEVFALIGPTGAGKSTLLRLLDQLENPVSGKIHFAGKDVSNSPKLRLERRRRMAMVFQKPVVFNASVYDNIAYPLKIRGYKRKSIFKKVSKMLEMVALKGYQKRNARTLSGGETQRVALARAMVTEPEVLLLDEPTANLDPLSVNLIEEIILRFNYEQGTTIVMATHDMSQGQRLANRISVLMEGELIQVDRSSKIFNTPRDIKVAKFVGMENILKGVIISNEDGVVRIDVNEQIIEGISHRQAAEEVYVCIRPEEITLSLLRPSISARNSFPGEISLVAFSGPLVKIKLRCPFPLVALITKKSAEEMELEAGKRVYVSFKATAIHIIGLK